jgi:hypothetical protein
MPELKWLKATKAFPYNGRDLKAGDYFKAAHFSDQHVLITTGQAVVVPDSEVPQRPAPAVVAPAPQPAELAVHKAEPKELVENRSVETVPEPEAVSQAPEKEVETIAPQATEAEVRKAERLARKTAQRNNT